MRIREASRGDSPRLGELLVQVCDVHHRGRPDLFRAGGRKYDDQALETLLDDGSRPILVAVDGEDRVLGYAFCVRQTRLAGASTWGKRCTRPWWSWPGPWGATM